LIPINAPSLRPSLESGAFRGDSPRHFLNQSGRADARSSR
jgi:hypothetical protein